MNTSTIVDGFMAYANLSYSMPKNPKVIDLFIGNLETTSADVVNQVIEDCSNWIHKELGLQTFHMSGFCDQNELTYWPFSQIVSKSPHLHTLRIEYLVTTVVNNICTVMQFCREICQTSDSLHTLHFQRTCSSLSDGEQFWSALADDKDSLKATLQNLTINYECNWWFKSEGIEEALAQVLLRQGATLKTLFMWSNSLSAEQKEVIRTAALTANPEC